VPAWRRLAALFLTLVLLALGAACGDDDNGDGDSGAADGPSIVVGSKLDTEAQLLGLMTAELLSDKGYDVATKIPLGSTDLVRKALTSGNIDIYWEFTSSGLSLLKETPVGDPQEAYRRVKELDADNGITWLPPAAMNDTYALAVKNGGPIAASTLTELGATVKAKPDTPLCVDPEGGYREDVLPRIADAYGLAFSEVKQIGYDLIPEAVAKGECQVGIVYSTAALIVKHDLRVVADDQQAFGAYTPAPTVKTDRLERWPNLAKDLAGLTAVLDTPTITKLNARADIDGLEHRDVARQFLTEQGLLSS
jgi:osmoprotectant transport system substrate-binding protein